MSKKHALQQLCEEIDVEVKSYSGRGMYGKECLSVRNANLGPFVAALVERAADGAVDRIGDVVYALEQMRTDSLGSSIVLYFEDVPFVSEDEEEQELLPSDKEELRKDFLSWSGGCRPRDMEPERVDTYLELSRPSKFSRDVVEDFFEEWDAEAEGPGILD